MKKLIIIISILLLAAACSKQAQVQPVQNQQPLADQTVNWKIYTNTRYGFDFKYPQNWTLDGGPSGLSEVQLATYSQVDFYSEHNAGGNDDTLFTVSVVSYPFTTSTKSCSSLSECAALHFSASQSSQSVPDKKESFILNGFNVEKIITKNNPKNSRTLYVLYLKKGDNMFVLDFNSPSDKFTINQAVYDQVAATFKFTNPADETANWKIYTNAKYGFEFKYPNTWELEDNNSEPSANLPEQNAQLVVAVSTKMSGPYLKPGEAIIHIARHPSANPSKFEEWFNKYKKVEIGPKMIGEETLYVTAQVTLENINFVNAEAKLQKYTTTQPIMEGGPTIVRQIYFVKNGVIWAIHFGTPPPDENNFELIFDQFTSTFKFTK